LWEAFLKNKKEFGIGYGIKTIKKGLKWFVQKKSRKFTREIFEQAYISKYFF